MLEDKEPASSDSKPVQFLQLNEVGLGYICCLNPTSVLQHPLSKAKYQEVTGPKVDNCTEINQTHLNLLEAQIHPGSCIISLKGSVIWASIQD